MNVNYFLIMLSYQQEDRLLTVTNSTEDIRFIDIDTSFISYSYTIASPNFIHVRWRKKYVNITFTFGVASRLTDIGLISIGDVTEIKSVNTISARWAIYNVFDFVNIWKSRKQLLCFQKQQQNSYTVNLFIKLTMHLSESTCKLIKR